MDSAASPSPTISRAAEPVARVSTPTFIPPDMLNAGGYELLASPSLYPTQAVRAGLQADASNREPINCRLLIEAYGADNGLQRHYGPGMQLAPGPEHLADPLRGGAVGEDPAAPRRRG